MRCFIVAGDILVTCLGTRRDFDRSYIIVVMSFLTSTGYTIHRKTKGLVTNYGEGAATKRQGEALKFYLSEKGGPKKF